MVKEWIRISKIIDLSHEIFHHMLVYPGDVEVEVQNHGTHEQTGYFNSSFHMGIHAGTHLDAPLHKLEGAKSVDMIPLDRFIGRALVMDATESVLTKEITLDMLAGYEESIKECDIVLVRTGWADFFGSERFYTEYPGFTEDAANWLASKPIKLIGIEMPSVHSKNHAKVHEIFLKKDIVIVESVANLKEIHKQYVAFSAAPLKLKGLEGSPVRAYAIED